MMKFASLSAAIIWIILASSSTAIAKADSAELFVNALMSGDTERLGQLLAPNFWYIGSNGHIRDKENFIKDIADKSLVVELVSLSNARETSIGKTRLLTANGMYKGHAPIQGPQGLMRFTMVLADNNGQEEVALFQATPVVATQECPDGNCRIK